MTNEVMPEKIGAVDVILVSHKHVDHFDVPSLKKFIAMNSETPIITIDEIGVELEKEGIVFSRIDDGDVREIAGFKVAGYRAPHGPLPIPVPDNIGFLIDDTLFHPGDSYEPTRLPACSILALPVAGPWSRLIDAIAMIEALKPKKVIPIHDAIIKDFMLERMYGMVEQKCQSLGIEFIRPQTSVAVKC